MTGDEEINIKPEDQYAHELELWGNIPDELKIDFIVGVGMASAAVDLGINRNDPELQRKEFEEEVSNYVAARHKDYLERMQDEKDPLNVLIKVIPEDEPKREKLMDALSEKLPKTEG